MSARGKTSEVIGISTAILFVVLWAVPLDRAVAFFRRTQAYFVETGSINASNDVGFSNSLLISYAISLFACLALAWLAYRRPRLALVIPFAMLMFAVVEVLRLRPEEPIVLFPTIQPWKRALISIAAVIVAVLVHIYFGALTRKKWCGTFVTGRK